MKRRASEAFRAAREERAPADVRSRALAAFDAGSAPHPPPRAEPPRTWARGHLVAALVVIGGVIGLGVAVAPDPRAARAIDGAAEIPSPSSVSIPTPASTPSAPRAEVSVCPPISEVPAPPREAHARSAKPPPTLAPRDAGLGAVVAPSPSIDEEIRQLEGVRGALRAGASARASSLLDAYAARFPAGQLSIEAIALRVETDERLGRHAAALSGLHALEARSPRHPSLPRLRRIVTPMAPSDESKKVTAP